MKLIKSTLIYLITILLFATLFSHCKSVSYSILGGIFEKSEKEDVQKSYEADDSTKIISKTYPTPQDIIDSETNESNDRYFLDSLGILSAVILDYEDNTPIADAVISIQGIKPLISDSIGTFETPRLIEGSYFLKISKEGYVTNAITLTIFRNLIVYEEIKLIKYNSYTPIGPKGGKLTGKDGLEIVIPKGALQTDTALSITVLPYDAYYLGVFTLERAKPLVNMYKLYPNGISFLKPVTISIPIQNVDSSLIERENIKLHIVSVESPDFTPNCQECGSYINTKVEDNKKYLHVQMNSFPKSTLTPPGWIELSRTTIATSEAKSPIISHCIEQELKVDFTASAKPFDLGVAIKLIFSIKDKAPCCKKRYINGELPIDEVVYDVPWWPFDKTIYQSGQPIFTPVTEDAPDGLSASGNCCGKSDDQCYKWICEGGAPTKIEKPNCEVCRKQCKECDPETGKCIDDKCKSSKCKECDGNGNCVSKCKEGQQCCNGVCEEIEYEYDVTTTVVTCDGSNITTSKSSYCTSGTTGVLEYSFGVCVGGSSTTTTCSGPHKKPCY